MAGAMNVHYYQDDVVKKRVFRVERKLLEPGINRFAQVVFGAGYCRHADGQPLLLVGPVRVRISGRSTNGTGSASRTSGTAAASERDWIRYRYCSERGHDFLASNLWHVGHSGHDGAAGQGIISAWWLGSLISSEARVC